jgi:hypothetical protein
MKRQKILGMKYYILALRKEGLGYRTISQRLLEKFNLKVSHQTIKVYLAQWDNLANLPTRQSIQNEFLRLSHLDQHVQLERRRKLYVEGLHHTPLSLARDSDFHARLFSALSQGTVQEDDIFELLYMNTMLVSYIYSPKGGGHAPCCECTAYFKERWTQFQFDDAPQTHDLHYDIVLPKAQSLVFDWKNGALYGLFRSLLKKRVLDHFIGLAKSSEKGLLLDERSLDRLYLTQPEKMYEIIETLSDTEEEEVTNDKLQSVYARLLRKHSLEGLHEQNPTAAFESLKKLLGR